MTYSDLNILTPGILLDGDLQLASSPNMYFALKRVMEDPNKSVHDAAQVIETDVGLTASLLKLVNSALYGYSGLISSVSRAIQLIGQRELQNLLIGMIIVERFSDLPGLQLTIHDFWASSLRCALITRKLDLLTGNYFADSAFVCGLLHNIGQMVFYRKIPALAHQVELRVQAQFPNPIDPLVVEREVIGFDRFVMGAALCEAWKLPEVICASIRLHNAPESASPYALLVDLLRLAQPLSHLDQMDQMPAAEDLNIDFEQLTDLLEQVDEEFEALFKLFYPIQH